MIETRTDLKTVYKEVSAEWYRRGAAGCDFADLRNAWSMVLNGKTATQIKDELGLSKRDTPWNYDSPIELLRNQMVGLLAKAYHLKRESKGKTELERDIRDTKPAIDAMTAAVEETLSDKRRSLPEPKPKQLALPKTTKKTRKE
jgi:hypothetical protein